MILCGDCGTENRESARFCLQCGAPLVPAQPDQPPQPEPMIEPEEAASEADLPAEPNHAAVEAAAPAASVEPETSAPNAQAEDAEQDTPAPAKADAETTRVVEEPTPAPEPVVEQEPVAELEPVVEKEPVAEPATEQETVADQSPQAIAASIPEAGETPPDQPADLDSDEASKETQADQETEPLVTFLPPIEPGEILVERFAIVGLLEETPEMLTYDAIDNCRCTQCNFGDSQPGDLYCARCGASLAEAENPAHVRLKALGVTGEAIIRLEEETEGAIECWFEADGRLYAVLPATENEPQDDGQAPFSRGIRHIVGYNSDVGRQRELDEDAMLVVTLAPMFESVSLPSLGLYAVADGMGGHASGEIASRIVIQKLSDIIVRRLFLPEMGGDPVLSDTPAAMLVEAIQTANDQIYALQQSTGSDMGTTLTTALVRDGHALVANIGDSRTYLWRQGTLRQITVDHSLVAQLVVAGAIEPDEIYTHPDKNAIYRSLGHSAELEVDLFDVPLEPGDRLLLCCDGVWEMLRDEGIEDVLLLEADPQRACDEIVRRSNLAGGEDNISVIIVQFEDLAG